MSRDNIREYYWPLLFYIVIFFGIPCYVNNLWLIPRFLMRRRYGMYLLLFCCLLLITAAISQQTAPVFNAMYPGINFMGAKPLPLFNHIFPALWTFIIVGIGKFMSDAIQNQIKLEDLQKQRLESELAALRSQINPHFLFNALNTIYGMSRRADPETPEAVLKLSDILRHNLYECDEPEISLEQEIYLLKQYIDLSRLRVYDKDSIQFETDAMPEGQKIAPLLLIPFVENAIKHGLGNNARNAWMHVKLALHGNTLHFNCSNSNKRKQPDILNGRSKGIGLNNVKRRLELLYPQKHKLTITASDDVYSVSLQIELQPVFIVV